MQNEAAQPTDSSSVDSRGFLFDLTDSIENNGNVHRALIARVEQLTGRNLICYMANPNHPGGAMQDHDPDILENLLRSLNLEEYGGNLDLLVNSPGGVPYSAAKIVTVCRTFSTHFRTVVLGRAMSAATLLCLGAHELMMGETASLGPIDPQMVRGQRLVPAHLILQSFREMLGAAQQAIQSKQPADPYFHVLDSLDVTAVYESIQATNATTAIAKDLLQDGLLRGHSERTDEVVGRLMTQGQQELHGKHIYPSFIQDEIGLPVTVLPVGSALDRTLRELFVRMELYINVRGLAKYIVSRQGGLDLNIQVQQQV